MFNGVQEQFHQLLSSSRASNNTNSLPQPFSFPPSNSLTYPTFDPFPPPHPHQLLHGRRLTEPVVNQKDEEKEESGFLSKSLLLLEKERLMAESMYPWTNEDVLSRFRIRSNMANCFPDSTWEHVSRKLGEVGFKRNAENCKDKFEEEGRYLDSVNFSKNYRLFGELEELYHGDNQQHQNSLALSQHHHHQKLSQDAADVQNEAAAAEEEAEGGRGEEEEEDDNVEQRVEDDSRTDNTEEGQAVDSHEKMVGNHSRARKRKRHSKKFEMFKGFCEIFVNKIMAHQEEMLHKFLEDMMKREEEKIAREEAWKKQEKERMKREMEFREHEQAIAGGRQAKIIEFLKNLTSKSTIYDHQNHYRGVGIENSNIEVPIYNSSKSPSIFNYKAITSTRFSSNMGKPHQNPSHDSPNLPSSSNDETQASQNPNSLSTQNVPFAPTSSLRKHPPNPTVTKLNQERSDDTGQRWLRDEVLALINLRCSFYNNGDDRERNNPKGPLWKGISKGMSELGYQRSAKRCKEKWENINKYFRKTKHINKKRSVDSRTCPYFHRLSYLYSQGTVVGTSHTPENCSLSPVNRPALMEPGNCSLHASDHGEDHAVHPTAGYLKIFNSS
ncbi:hypothetical protein Nepgr_009645 [Nepenthes gracilis]|uniref:Myb-like domain-containing protein n=1 Tax=Nepenthes gracilis TaxID=150966 RepID=A0AAD3SAX7_NEPGR|nr:hypothetical protein Nepgr_009645 [Nepenthes gracilis]